MMLIARVAKHYKLTQLVINQELSPDIARIDGNIVVSCENYEAEMEEARKTPETDDGETEGDGEAEDVTTTTIP